MAGDESAFLRPTPASESLRRPVGADAPGRPLLPLWGNSPSAHIGPASVETRRTLSGFMELLTRREPLFFIQTGRSEFGLFQGFDAQNA